MEHQPKKDSGAHFGNPDVDKITISGTCNVCTTPCSSCMHNERMESTMESKVEGACQEKNVKKETDNFSSVNFEEEHTYKCRPCDGGEHATSEGSNFSVSSTHDSLSENAESNAASNIPETCNAPKGADMSNKVFPVETVSEGRMQIKSKEPESVNTQSSSYSGDDSVGIQPAIGEKKLSLTKDQSFPVTTINTHKIAKELSDEEKNTAIDAVTVKLSHGQVKSENFKEENGNSANEFVAAQPSMEPDQVSDNSNDSDASEDDVCSQLSH